MPGEEAPRMAKSRVSRAGQIFQGRKNFDGTFTYPLADDSRNDPTYIPRLTWKYTPQMPANWSELIETVKDSGDVAWFCDNGVFDDVTPDELWTNYHITREPGRE